MRALAPALWLALPLALTSCSLFGGGAATVEARFAFDPPATAAGLAFGVAVETESDTRTLSRGDFWAVGERQFDADPLTVAARPARVTCTVGRGGVESAVTVEVDLQDDWRYGVSCRVSERDPEDGCFGCRGSAVAALDPALGFDPALRLGVAWGGDPRDSGVVY